MNSYLSFIPISAKVHRRQNRMTNLCIIISVFLVTAIFSMADMMVRQETARLVEKHGATEVQAFLERPVVLSTYPVAALLFVFILIAGVLMIAGSMNSNVAQRTKFFGMMRCIGMSKKQIIRMVRLEALHWCKTSIPIGVICGTVANCILCAVMKYGIGGEFNDMPQLGISIIGIVSGILVGLITVLIAAGKPAKRASKVSPVTAISSNTDNRIKNSIWARMGFIKIETALGINHSTGSKKNLFLMTGSFALSIILFLSFSVLVNLVNYLLPQSASAADIEISSKLSTNDIDRDLVETISNMDGVERIFGRRSSFDVAAECNQEDDIHAVDIISFDRFDLESLKKDGLLEKNSDLSEVFGDSEFALLISDSELGNGTVFTTYEETIRIAGKLKYDPFSSDGSTKGRTTLIVSDETYTRLTGVNDYALVLIQLNKKATDENVNAISNILDDNCVFKNNREDNTHGTYLGFLFCTYGFIAVIAMVSILNIVNSISMSVSARMKQYGVMRAVGMDESQLIKMIASEAITYAVSGCIAGLVLGLLFSRWLYGFLITSHFSYAHWSLPISQIAIIIVFVAVAVTAGVHIPSKRIRGISVTESINEL